jgi:AcrR family transcriptional regulator
VIRWLAVKRLQRLNTQHKAACRLKVEGRTIDYISEHLGVAPRTLHVWFSDDLVKEEIERILGDVDDLFKRRLAESGFTALDELNRFAALPAAKVTWACTSCTYEGAARHAHMRDLEVVAEGGPRRERCDGPWEKLETISQGTKMAAIESVLDRVDQTTRLRDRAEAVAAANEGGGEVGAGNLIQVFQAMPDHELTALFQQWLKDGSIDADPGTAKALPKPAP